MRTKHNPDAVFQSVGATARITGLSRGYIYGACRSGECPAIRVGNDWRVNLPLFRAILDQKSQGEQK